MIHEYMYVHKGVMYKVDTMLFASGTVRILNEKNQELYLVMEDNNLLAYTGREDKAGEKLWDRDVIEITYNNGDKEIGLFEWDDDILGFLFTDPDGGKYSVTKNNIITRLGNSVTNPGLLEF